ncbi:hypothetical protein GOA63_28125 [Sinorhizobium meliloti]|uniref:hypothetical protein n=1 Tax=Rhizobium meliloti TaxID=382 RepID=UPI0012956EB8|nr:hypothetical protein [Sinorhizobium meliloti]MDW9596037.1 hypothetical protein [Sinorhizobium meliloti]MDX0191485.1 hypothetical protein [Sinorhizobium meliloti]MQV10759.1 hypothetical protein [Sinorhizobium meliloti]
MVHLTLCIVGLDQHSAGNFILRVREGNQKRGFLDEGNFARFCSERSGNVYRAFQRYRLPLSLLREPIAKNDASGTDPFQE